MQTQTDFFAAKLQFEMDAADLFEALESGSNIVLIDTRQVAGYRKEHLPSAVNLPHRTMTVQTTRHLDKEKVYVCYCDGVGCNGSTKGALKLAELGFTVKELIGGLDWWKRDGYATSGEAAVDGKAPRCNC